MQKLLCGSLVLLVCIGCGGKAEYFSDTAGQAPATAEQAEMNEGNVPALATKDAADKPDQAADEQDAQKAERKIIYEAEVSLVVEDFENLETAIPKLVKEFEGYMNQSNFNRSEGRRRYGRWVARIPSARYTEFLTALSELGTVEHQQQTAQDVTMEYLDVEARIATKKELEQRIISLLADRDAKLSDVIEAERELARVRSEIESMEGRLRFLQNQTSFSTVTINAREGVAPNFTGRIGTAWHDSLRSLKIAGQNFVIGLVAFVPWIPPLAVAVGVLIFVGKRIQRSRKAKKA